jgi:beta-fructofuranosidase
MYAGYGFRSFEIGDVDVILHDGTFHLFHLVLPNHDYIAHAVSNDGLTWRRVANALFISDPGGWDDDMLWTMHVTRDPHQPGWWRMFYTGLNMREQGKVQRVGVARSCDLFVWEKTPESSYPLAAAAPHYESTLEEGRGWVSFRDPFYFHHDGTGYLLAAGRVPKGPLIRRGCIALAEEVEPDRFELRPPLYHPGRYDDIEVPAVVHIDGRYYLIGSIREDVKVHYWHADDFHGPYRNFHDNVLLPQGNYAARVVYHEAFGVWLVWNFFFREGSVRGENLLPPPKEVAVTDAAHLRMRSFRGFDHKVTGTAAGSELMPLDALFDRPGATCEDGPDGCVLEAASGFEVFLVPGVHRDYRLSGTLEVDGDGKLGLVMHLSGEGDGYFLSLDPFKGVTQIRYWAHNPKGGIEESFEYRPLQASFQVPRSGPIPFTLISYGTYLELSLYGYVVLTLADDRQREGRTGFYAESCRVRVTDLRLETLTCPESDPCVSPQVAV